MKKRKSLRGKPLMVARLGGLTGEVEWYTPRKYLDAAAEVMGCIDLDPASSDLAQQHVRAKRWFTLKQDGLAQAWTGKVWLNPPYRMPDVQLFTRKLIDSWQSGAVSEAIVVVNNATDTAWFHDVSAACSALCFTRGRISFIKVTDGVAEEKCAGTVGQVFLYFGTNVPRFVRVFGKLGAIMRCQDNKLREAA